MEELGINMMAILVAVVANFVLGYLWYTPLFGKVWAREMGFDTSGNPSAARLASGMTLMVIGNFFLAFVFAHNIVAWSFVPGTSEMSKSASILNAVGFTWLGFFLPMDLSRLAWENRSLKLFAINTGYHFTLLLVAAVIIYYM